MGIYYLTDQSNDKQRDSPPSIGKAMSTQDRKQRQIKNRERLILDIAKRHLLEHGYTALSMDHIAEEMEYSKGTIYTHFKSKEDILMSLAGELVRKRHQLFLRATGYSENSRERIFAVGIASVLFAQLHPCYFRIESLLRDASLIRKVTPQHQAAYECEELLCVKLTETIIRNAISTGDLTLRKSHSVRSIAFGFWSLTVGGLSHIVTDGPQLFDEVGDAYTAVIQNCQTYLDGLLWHPLSDEWDSSAFAALVCQEVFPDEYRCSNWQINTRHLASRTST